MEEKEEYKYSYSEDQADRILRTREESTSVAELMSWMQSVDHIVTNYHDGYISDDDIASKKEYIDDSIYREAMLITALGLYEKSRNPAAQKKASQLKTLIAKLRACRQILNEKTPPLSVAKRIQAKQRENLQQKMSSSTLSPSDIAHNAYTGNDGAIASAVIGMIGINYALKLSEHDLDQLVDIAINEQNQSSALNGSKPLPKRNKNTQAIIDMIKSMHAAGLSKEQIIHLANSNIDNDRDMIFIRDLFSKFPQLQPNQADRLTFEKQNYEELVRSSIDRHNAMHTNAYDYNLTQQLVSERINSPERTKDDILRHLEAITHKRTTSPADLSKYHDSLRNKAFSIDNCRKMLQSDNRHN